MHDMEHDEFPPIPEFLRRIAEPGPARSRTTSEAAMTLPPDSMVPVLRAIKGGRDTMQKLRAGLGGKHSDRDIRDGIAALIRVGSVRRTGRRYTTVRGSTGP